MSKSLLAFTLTLLLTCTNGSASGPFGSTDPEQGIYPIDCYSCAKNYGGYYFCNVANSFGACCPYHNSGPYCQTDSHHDVKCSEDDENHDFLHQYCIWTNSKQCGGETHLNITGEDTEFEIDVTNIF